MTQTTIEVHQTDLQPEESIEISSADLDKRDLLDQLTSPQAKEVTLDDGSRVMLGLPPTEDNNFIVGNSPYVFKTDRTLIREGSGTAVQQALDRDVLQPVKVQVKGALQEYLNLGPCTVIYAHGTNKGAGDAWYFGDGQNIPQVTLAYNRFAVLHHLPSIELIAACNADPNEVDLKTNMPISETNDMRVGAFNEVSHGTFSIAYAVGEKAQAGGRIDREGKINFLLQTQRESIFNLDNLIAMKEYPV